ncbi:MAG: hypothetical protein CM15mV25_0980 [uncultured marine virus]|nr:MAG: hypothetical protein CM15mV25_0980 [uncultured marine virus]
MASNNNLLSGDGKDEDSESQGLNPDKFISITDKTYQDNTAKITQADIDYNYVNLPDGSE